MAAGRLTGDHRAPFHWMFHEPWDKAFWAEYSRAKAYRNAVNFKNLRKVLVMSYSCSGTHNFYTHFHYMPAAFAFGENLFMDRGKDPFQFSLKFSELTSAHFLFGSAFLEQGLQEKRGEDLTHAFLLSNHYLRYAHPLPIESLAPRDKLIFYQRNFLRVLFSQNRDGHKYKKDHFVMNDERFLASLRQHRKRMAEMLALLEKGDSRIQLCIHERFCADPAKVIAEVCNGLDIAEDARSGWNEPEKFFTRCYRSGLMPEKKDGKLWIPGGVKPIVGKGGEYNPLPPISLERTISAPIKGWYTGSRLEAVQKAFGRELTEFWLEDQSFDYANSSLEYLTSLLVRGIVAGENV